MKIENKIALYYVAFGAGIGSVSTFVELKAESWATLFFAVFLFYVSCKLVPRVFDLVENPPPGGSSTWGLVKLGFLPYFIMWLTFWIMVYTLTV